MLLWVIHSFIHSFIHSLVINHVWYNNNIQEIYNTFKIIYTILTKLFTKLNVESGNDEEAYIEAGGLYSIGFLELLGTPCELRLLNEKWVIFKSKEKKGKRKCM